ncbi:hypothetical protein VOI54_15485 [Tamlana sp. 2201CG12-4]|uniref:hypothetical protein n=1 Tax=Tamlana sp. 2201CG12-4 TaxID=3112582 RepID=UPI002DB81CDE|nr:hypothetical protein [Tamlana sp. 2201CG12-4]MEC3908432.1 hypothetical protein [Tamlana sp. 2201CG12-4]
MKKLIFILLITLSSGSFAQNKSCHNFHTGQFEYTSPKYAEWQVTRTDTTQIETSSKSGLEIYSVISWQSDCEYTLTCSKVSNPDFQKLVGKVFNVTITKTFGDNRYTCISKCKAMEIPDLKLEMVKVN